MSTLVPRRQELENHGSILHSRTLQFFVVQLVDNWMIRVLLLLKSNHNKNNFVIYKVVKVLVLSV